MAFEFRVEQIQISDQSSVHLLPSGVTVFVGPNNVGKTRLLREIQTALRGNEPRVVIRNVILHRQASAEEFEDWMTRTATRRFDAGTEHWHLEGTRAPVQHSFDWFKQGPPIGSNVSNFFVRLLDAESRLSLASPTTSFNVLTDAPSTALHQLFLDVSLEDELSRAFRAAFGTGVVLNRLGGNHISLHIGEPLDVALGDARTYLTEIALRPEVSQQGDGIRSYLGILLAALASPWPILLIDEPEAFLHPPQARTLGRQLAEIAAGTRQVVVATHSADVVRGLLDGPPGSVTINRLTREGQENHVAKLPAADLEVMWSDPLLRYSNFIDGLFHPGVVVCESDADCRYYEAVLQSLTLAGEVPGRDWLFAHCGGKHRMPRIVSALKSAGVPVRVIADIDILKEAQPLVSCKVD